VVGVVSADPGQGWTHAPGGLRDDKQVFGLVSTPLAPDWVRCS